MTDEPVGKREAHKRATRSAVEEAARRLFAEHGFEATTVRDIAYAAGVNERTFFRYFAGKEELILDDVLAWLPLFQDAIRARPAQERPLVAVAHAASAMLAAQGPRTTASPLWLFLDGPPVQRLGPSWRSFLMRIETGVAEAIDARLDPGSDDDQPSFEAQLAARVSLAVFRSVLIHDAHLRLDAGAAQAPDRPAIAQLLESALATVHADSRRPRSTTSSQRSR